LIQRLHEQFWIPQNLRKKLNTFAFKVSKDSLDAPVDVPGGRLSRGDDPEKKFCSTGKQKPIIRTLRLLLPE
jgi:hypothetical protein